VTSNEELIACSPSLGVRGRHSAGLGGGLAVLARYRRRDERWTTTPKTTTNIPIPASQGIVRSTEVAVAMCEPAGYIAQTVNASSPLVNMISRPSPIVTGPAMSRRRRGCQPAGGLEGRLGGGSGGRVMTGPYSGRLLCSTFEKSDLATVRVACSVVGRLSVDR
jgi:hypothetical protein